MALEVPQLVYARREEDPGDTLTRALRLARELEELLEETTGVTSREALRGAHATRIVRAMAASLVDELDALVRSNRKSGVA